jgi:hypothetical protein
MYSEEKDWEWGFESHSETLPQYLHISFTPVAAFHIGKSAE